MVKIQLNILNVDININTQTYKHLFFEGYEREEIITIVENLIKEEIQSPTFLEILDDLKYKKRE